MKKVAEEGKCGESKPSSVKDMKDSKAMSEAMAKKAAEGKCGEDKKMKEGNCSAMKKADKEGKCGEGKCGASKR